VSAAAQPAPGAVLCAGRLYCDLVFSDVPSLPEPGREVYAGGLTVAAGGGAYITAAYLAALGRPVALAAEWPASPFREALRPEMQTSGVDFGPCAAPAPGIDPQITVGVVAGGDRAFLTRRAGRGLPAGLEAALAARRWRHLHIGELATLVEHPGILPAARAAGMSVSLDCSWDDAILARSDLWRLTEGVDVFLPNRAEAEALARHAPIERHAPLVVIKDGPQGAEAVSAAGRLTRPACAVTVVDTVGAGDAFNAGFLDAWLAGRTLADCLDAGSRTAAVALSRAGGARGLAPRQHGLAATG
jgi:sugar/nucleoside kinase (ribokinase family)